MLELKTRIQTLVEDIKNVRAIDTDLDATSSASHVHCSVPNEPVQQGNWVTARVKTLLFHSDHKIKQVLPTK